MNADVDPCCVPESRLDPSYLAGVRLFNDAEFFAAHDAWEDLWRETLGEQRGFYQGLIHAAVALHHFEEGNLGGARKMYHSCQRYLEPYPEVCLGLDLARFRSDMQTCFRSLLQHSGGYPSEIRLVRERIPSLMMQVPVPDEGFVSQSTSTRESSNVATQAP